jgi:hypothetical protein
MIPKKPALGLDPRMDTGFPPARSQSGRRLLSFGAWAREAKSEKIMLKEQAKAKHQIDVKIILL